jgi:hypothetical protein
MSPVKEPHFFSSPEFPALLSVKSRALLEKTTPRSIDEYQRLFQEAHANQICGEASASYFLLSNVCIPRIRAALGDVRIVISLRNPYERCWSEFSMHYKQKLFADPGSHFINVTSTAPWSVSECPLQFVEQSLYFLRVKAFLRGFSHVHVILVDDLVKAPAVALSSLYQFLGVNPELGEAFISHSNQSPGFAVCSSAQRSLFRLASRLIRPLASRIGCEDTVRILRNRFYKGIRRRLPLPEPVRTVLTPLFSPDIQRLEGLLGRDLSCWRQ